jgi:DNA-binding response OmpR family regulator
MTTEITQGDANPANTCECPYCHQQMQFSGDAVLDKLRHTVERNGVRRRLTPQQFELFSLLYSRIGRPIRHGAIYDNLFGARPDCDQPDSKILAVLTCALRRYLKPLGFEIKTLWGVGLELNVCAEIQESKEA